MGRHTKAVGQLERQVSDLLSKRLKQIIAELESLGTEDRAVNEKRYLKSPESMRHIGVTVPAIRKVAKGFQKANSDLDHDEVIVLAKECWSQEIHETRMIAIEVLNAYSKSLSPADVALIEKMINESHTWAYVDNLSAHTMGRLIKRFPETADVLDEWAKSENFWLRRAAMLSLLIPLRDGAGEFEQFAGYADSMLSEKEFFIRKAIGWILRDMSKKRPQLALDWLEPRAHMASTLTVREATRHMPKEKSAPFIAAAKSGEPVSH